MIKSYFLPLVLLLTLFSSPGAWMAAQESEPNIRVVVDMVQLNVAVTDNKGNYVTGLRPSDFAVIEDNIPQKLATFGEGDEPAYRVADGTTADGKTSGQVARATASSGSKAVCRSGSKPRFDGGRRQCFPPLRHQQLHVPRLCVRARCHRGFRPFAGKCGQGRLLFVQPGPFPIRPLDP